MLRQTMETLRNPNAMREAMRSQDLMMSQLENHPGGFNALRRMYEEVQEPMMQASADAAAASSAATSAPANPSPAPVAPSSTALPNPWGPSPNTANPNSNPFAAMGGMGGFPGMGGMGGMGGGMPPNMAAMMQNPMMQQMMQQMLADPATIQQVRRPVQMNTHSPFHFLLLIIRCRR